MKKQYNFMHTPLNPVIFFFNLQVKQFKLLIRVEKQTAVISLTPLIWANITFSIFLSLCNAHCTSLKNIKNKSDLYHDTQWED